MADGSVKIEIEVDSKEAEQEFNKVGQAAKETAGDVEDLGEKSEKAGGGLDKAAVAAGAFIANLAYKVVSEMAAQIEHLVKAVIEVGKEFSSSMSEVQAISGATGEELTLLEQTAREYGATTVFSASEAADALKYMALAGWDTQQSISGLPGILDLAAASGMDLAAASDMVTDYLTAFGLQASDSTRFADMLAYAQSNANTTAEGLGEAFKNCAANLNAAGQDVETTTSLLSMMANQGLKGSEAGTALAAVMRDLTASMKDGAISIGDTSVQVMDANGNYRDLTDILADVEAATDGMGDAERAAALSSAFTSDSIKGLNLILNAGTDEAAKFEEELRNSSGTASEMAEVMNDNLAGDIKEAQSAFEELGLKIYDKLETPLRDAMSVVTNSVIPGLEKMMNNFPVVAAVVGGLAAALLAYKIEAFAVAAAQKGLSVATYAAKTAQELLNVTFLASPAFWVVAAIAAIVAAFILLWKNSESFRNFWINLWESIKSVCEPVFTAIKALFSAVWDGIKQKWEEAQPFFTVLWEVIKSVFSAGTAALGSFFRIAWEVIKAVWDGVVAYFQILWAGITGVFSVVVAFFGGLFSSAWAAIQLVWNTVTGYFAAVWATIEGIFAVVKAVLSGDFQGAWDAIQGIVDTWGRYFEMVWENIQNVFSAVAEWFGEVFRAAKDAISNVWDGIKDYFQTVFDGIVNVFSSIKSEFTSVGSNIISGIWAGISAGWDWLVGKVKSLADSLLSAAKQVLGIASPSKKFRWIGEMSAEGVSVGFDDVDIEKGVTAKLQGLTAHAQAIVSAESARMSRGSGTADSGFGELARAVSTQTAGINSLAGEYRRGSGSSKPVVLMLDGRELGRAVVDLGSAEANRLGTRLAY